MSEPFLAWFELRSDHGRDYAENLEPIREVALTLNLPRMTAGGVMPTGTQVCTIKPADALTDELLVRIIPGTRIIETSSMLTAQALYSRSEYVQLVDEPTQAYVKAANDETRAHMDAVAKRAAAVATGGEHPADINDPNPAPPPLTGAVSFAFTADERLTIDKGIEANEIDNDDDFAVWVATTTIDDLVTAAGDDRLLALRILVAEQARGDARKGLVEKLAPIATTED